MTTLDITSFKQKGAELAKAIEAEIKPLANSKLIVPLPDILRMTQVQYDDLMKLNLLPEMYQFENMFHTEDRMYQTKYNVMEVRVSNRTKATFEEAHSLSDKEFEKWEKFNVRET